MHDDAVTEAGTMQRITAAAGSSARTEAAREASEFCQESSNFC